MAYIDEVEVTSTTESRKTYKDYYSVLVKASLSKTDDPSEQVQNLDQVMPFHIFVMNSVCF